MVIAGENPGFVPGSSSASAASVAAYRSVGYNPTGDGSSVSNWGEGAWARSDFCNTTARCDWTFDRTDTYMNESRIGCRALP